MTKKFKNPMLKYNYMEQNKDDIVIMFISDLHFNHKQDNDPNDFYFCQRKICLDNLLDFLTKIKLDWKPDILSVVGDLAYYGIKKDYDYALTWLKKIQKILGITSQNLLLCTGNHDRDRNKCKDIKYCKDRNEANSLISLNYISNLFCGFGDFINFKKNELKIVPNKFGSRSGSFYENYLFGSKTIEDINFVELNSSWFSKSNEDFGKLYLGKKLLHTLNAHNQIQNRNNSNQLSVVIFHHPPHWFGDYNEFYNDFEYINEKCQVVVTGHEHKASSLINCQTKTLQIRLGSTYSNYMSKNSFYLLRISKDINFLELQQVKWDPYSEKWEINYQNEYCGYYRSPNPENYTTAQIEKLIKKELSLEENKHANEFLKRVLPQLKNIGPIPLEVIKSSIFPTVTKEKGINEFIPDQDYIFRYVHLGFINDKKPEQIMPRFFSFLNGSMSIAWSKYISAEELFEQLKEKKNEYGILRMKVSQLREIKELEVSHTPTPENKSHALITIKSHEPKSTQILIRVNLAKIAEWAIKPVVKKPIQIVITCIGCDEKELLEKIISIINSSQKSFEYTIFSSLKSENYRNRKEYFTTNEIFNLLRDLRKQLSGNKSNIIGLCKLRLNGETYSNLFSSLEEKEGRFTGLGVITLYQLTKLLDKIPIEVYLLYRFIDYGFRLIIGHAMGHTEPEHRFCFYDLKTTKKDINVILKNGILCEKCTGKLKSKFRSDQLAEFYNLLEKIVLIAKSSNPKANFLDLYNNCISKSEFKQIAWSNTI